MASEEEIIKNLEEEIPAIDKIIEEQNYTEANIGKLEYFVSRIILLAEINTTLKESTIITRIREEQNKPGYPRHNMHIIISNAKGLLDTIKLYQR